MLDAEEKESESLLRICQVLMLSGIEYGACQSLEQPIAVSQMTSSLPWSEIDVELNYRPCLTIRNFR